MIVNPAHFKLIFTFIFSFSIVCYSNRLKITSSPFDNSLHSYFKHCQLYQVAKWTCTRFQLDQYPRRQFEKGSRSRKGSPSFRHFNFDRFHYRVDHFKVSFTT